jgi:hypothetical protein
MYFQKLLFLLITVLQRPNKYLLLVVKHSYKFMAVSIAVFFFNVLPLLPGTIAEVYAQEVSPALVLAMFSYLLLIFAASLSFWQVADQCTIKLKNRFDIEP